MRSPGRGVLSRTAVRQDLQAVPVPRGLSRRLSLRDTLAAWNHGVMSRFGARRLLRTVGLPRPPSRHGRRPVVTVAHGGATDATSGATAAGSVSTDEPSERWDGGEHPLVEALESVRSAEAAA